MVKMVEKTNMAATWPSHLFGTIRVYSPVLSRAGVSFTAVIEGVSVKSEHVCNTLTLTVADSYHHSDQVRQRFTHRLHDWCVQFHFEATLIPL